jgi:hypothetical protein
LNVGPVKSQQNRVYDSESCLASKMSTNSHPNDSNANPASYFQTQRALLLSEIAQVRFARPINVSISRDVANHA